MWAHRCGRDTEKCEQFIQLTPQSQGLPDRQTVNNILHILTWFHSSVVNHEQMGQCDCHVNNVPRSIIWGTVVVTAHVASHGRRLKVGYDLSWITGRLCNLLRLGDTPHCILKHSLSVFGWPTRESREDITVCKRWQLSAHSEWCPICLLFLLEAQFQFHFVCWQISSAQTRQQWISCKVVCLNHSGRNVHTLFTRSHKIEENCKLSRQAETLEGEFVLWSVTWADLLSNTASQWCMKTVQQNILLIVCLSLLLPPQ